MRPPDLVQLKDDLINFRAELEEPGVRAGLIETGLPRLLATLEMIPEEARAGDVLELGASPYFLSLCLRRLCSGQIVHGNYFGTPGRHGADRLVHQGSGEELVFEFDLFNIESDDFPYADASFDVVVFSELIEHLGLNPVRTLSEIHRVLNPGGCVVVTTPNFLSLERLASFLRGGSQMVDRYSPLFGYGARHNREYHPRELRELLEGCGFVIETMALRDLAPLAPRERWQRSLWRRLAALYSDTPREEHIFLRARRGGRFRWSFPPSLFDNIQFYTLVRYAWMEMGINDTIQAAAGWHWDRLETRPGGGGLRWIADTGQAFLKTPDQATHVALEVYAGPAVRGPLPDPPPRPEVAAGEGTSSAAPGALPAALHVVVWDRWLGRVKAENVYVDATVPIECGRWQRLELPIGPHRANPGDEVEVRLTPAPGQRIAVHRVEYVT